uniref:F-box domain-containing protein n=1 Tax=Aegilops tauschii subsp. strangulata TaxID=200361 RepID=A0A453JCL3_AEGTS
GRQLPAAAKPPSIPSAATATATYATVADGTTTISSLGQDQLLEIFLRLANLLALVRAALTCRSWLGAVRSSRPFRRLFRALHPAPLLGLFLEVDEDAGPSFAPLRRTDPDVAAALRHGDFFLTSLPAYTGWGIVDCRDGYILLWNWNMMSVAAVNPMTWAVDIIPLPEPEDAREGCLRGFPWLGSRLLSCEENPWSFRVVCVCADVSRVRAAVFSSETWDWAIHPWVEIGGDDSLKYNAGMLVHGSVYWPFHGEHRMIRINTATTMEVTNVDLPSQVDVERCNYKAGETKDGQLCIVHASHDDFLPAPCLDPWCGW